MFGLITNTKVILDETFASSTMSASPLFKTLSSQQELISRPVCTVASWGEKNVCVRKSVGHCRHALHIYFIIFFFILIKEETGTDVSESQTGCCDYNTMKMPGGVVRDGDFVKGACVDVHCCGTSRFL